MFLVLSAEIMKRTVKSEDEKAGIKRVKLESHALGNNGVGDRTTYLKISNLFHGTIAKKKRSVRSKPVKTGWVNEKPGQPNDGDRRVLRSKNQDISNLIRDKTDDAESEKFRSISIVNKVEQLHQSEIMKQNVKSEDEKAIIKRKNVAGDADRRFVRSKYLKISNLIHDGADSEKLTTMLDEVEHLHQFVEKPREQAADAGALLYITKTLLTSIKSHSGGPLTASEFISCLLRNYGTGRGFFRWKDLGRDVSPVFKRFTGCCTMIGPMEIQLKSRRAAVQRSKVVGQRKQTERYKIPPSCPEEIGRTEPDTRTDTDINIAKMFEILKEKRSVRLECLILNRKCFAQTVENLFALSFLVKDGRAEISIDENNCHIVSPKNAPCAVSVLSGQVCYNHFIFRYDFKDWQMMLNSVPFGWELMPHRNYLEYSKSSPLERLPSKEPIIEEHIASEVPLEEGNAGKFTDTQEISSGSDKDCVIELSSGCSDVIEISSEECSSDEDSVVEITQEKRNTYTPPMKNVRVTSR